MTTFNRSFQARLSGLALALAAAGVIGLSAPVLAHDHGERGIERLTEKLELTTEQADAISNLYSAHREQMRSIEFRDDDGQRDRAAWQQARESRQALNEEILAILNEEQAQKFETMKQRGKQRARHRGHGLRNLDLSDEQRARIRELMVAQREQGGDRAAFRQQMREILSEEQIAELEAQREKRAGQRGSRGERGERSRRGSHDG